MILTVTMQHRATGECAYITLNNGVLTVEIPTLRGTATRTYSGTTDDLILEAAGLIGNCFQFRGITED